MVALYFAYMPLVIGITNVAKLIDMGPFQPFWSGLAPTFGLTFMVSFLPTFIISIFKVFFTLKAEAWAQHQLQKWYFWFQLIFVVLATAVGQNTRDFTKALATDPLSIFDTLANSMPYATHFYMNFLTMQWVTHGMNLLRYMNLIKYKSLCAVYEEEEAHLKSEPEDQDYYGLGSRNARWSINLVITIVYGTLSPTIYLLGFINFALCRIVYGYLIPYAETKKPDLGGVFWTTAMQHVYIGLFVFSSLMFGVLSIRGDSWLPAVATVPTFVYIWYSLQYFNEHFAWEKLPFHELMSAEGKARSAAIEKRELSDEYVQRELLEPTSPVASS